MNVVVLPAQEYRRQRWQNGLGWTREIIRQPADGDFHWRASIAEIDHDCTFSPFPGYQRLQALIEGAGFVLRRPDGECIELLPPNARTRFDGDTVLQCALQAGPARAFNLIFDPETVDADLLHRPLVGPMVFFCNARSSWLIHLLRGDAWIRDAAPTLRLSAGDSLWLTSDDDASERLLLDGGGELLVVRLQDPARPG